MTLITIIALDGPGTFHRYDHYRIYSQSDKDSKSLVGAQVDKFSALLTQQIKLNGVAMNASTFEHYMFTSYSRSD